LFWRVESDELFQRVMDAAATAMLFDRTDVQ
jgi:hypothetical protein